MESINLMSELKILPEPQKIMDGYISFTKGKNQDDINNVNKIITETNRNGEIKAIIDQYIKYIGIGL